MTPPRVLIFSLAFEPFIGGAEIAVKEIVSRLPHWRFDLLTVNLSGCEQQLEKINNITVFRLGFGKLSKYFFPWQAARAAAELHKTRHYAAVWAIMANQAGLAALFFKQKHPDVPYLLTLQEGDSEWDIWLRTWFMRRWYRRIYERADAIQAISFFLARRAERLGALVPVRIIPNGVDLELFSAIYPRTMIPGIRPNRQIIIHTGRLVKKNGLADLIRALHFLPPTVELCLIGRGKDEEKLRRLARRLGLESRVLFIGHLPPDRLSGYLAHADVFVRPSYSEGLGNSFLEAMAVGLPTVGTPVGGIVDFLKDGETGWLVEVGNPQSIASKVKYILDQRNRGAVSRVSATGRRLVFEKYSWSTVARQMDDLLARLVGRR